MALNLSIFRSSFIDAQNHANFFGAVKDLMTEFRYFLMEEDCLNFKDDNVLTLHISKHKAIFGINLDGKSAILVLDKKGYNYAEDEYTVETFKKASKDMTILESISLYDSQNIRLIVNKLAQMFIGENFEIIENL